MHQTNENPDKLNVKHDVGLEDNSFSQSVLLNCPSDDPRNISLKGTSKTDTNEYCVNYTELYSKETIGNSIEISSNNKFTIDNNLVFKLCLAVTLGSFIIGLAIASFNTCIDHIAQEFEWCPPGIVGCSKGLQLQATATSAIYVGCLIGSLLAGCFLEKSRKQCLCLFAGGVILTTINEATNASFASVVWGRFLTGICCGALACTSSIMLGEFAPKNHRGFYGSFYQIAMTMGILLTVTMGNGLSQITNAPISAHDRIWWRVTIAFPVIPAVLILYIFNFVYKFDTPQYIYQTSGQKEALQLFSKLYNGNEKLAQEACEALISASNQRKEIQNSKLTLSKILKIKRYRTALFVGCSIAFFHQFTGINALNAASNRFFEGANMSTDLATLMSTILMIFHAVFSFPALYVTDKLGRRPVILFGLFLMTLSVGMAAVGSYLQAYLNYNTAWLTVIGTISFIAVYSGTYGAIASVYISEMYPLEIKPISAGITNGLHWLCAVLVVYLSQVLPESISFTIFTISGIIGFLVLYFNLKETKGRDVNTSPYGF